MLPALQSLRNYLNVKFITTKAKFQSIRGTKIIKLPLASKEFGTTRGKGSQFGFWLSYQASRELAKETYRHLNY